MSLIYKHTFYNYTIKSVRGFTDYINGKDMYIIRGSAGKRINSITHEFEYYPVILCDQKFNQYPDVGSIPQEVTDMEGWITDYITNYDALEEERDLKLNDACAWKLEQLTMNGVDLLDAVERKVWQQRPDLLSNAEKDALIDEWEAS